MTKMERRELDDLNAMALFTVALGDWSIGYLARSYSALARATLTRKTREAIIKAASEVPAIVQHPDFIC